MRSWISRNVYPFELLRDRGSIQRTGCSSRVSSRSLLCSTLLRGERTATTTIPTYDIVAAQQEQYQFCPAGRESQNADWTTPSRTKAAPQSIATDCMIEIIFATHTYISIPPQTEREREREREREKKNSAVRNVENTTEKQNANSTRNVCFGRAELDLQNRLRGVNFCELKELRNGRKWLQAAGENSSASVWSLRPSTIL